MRIFFAIAILFAVGACSRQVTKNISKGDVMTHEQSTKADTTKEQSLETSETTVHYGDSLKASLNFNALNKTDVIESNGIKIEGKLVDMGNGNISVDINAISKPTSSTTKTTSSKSKSAGSSEQKTIARDSTYTTRDIHKKSKVSSTGIIGISFLILIIIAVVIYVYKKFAPPWMKIF